MKNILLLGASGSIGRQTLDILSRHPDKFELTAFSIGEKVDEISKIMGAFPNVKYLCIRHKTFVGIIQKQYPKVKIYHGDRGLRRLVGKVDYDLMVNALVGFVGFLPTILALKRGKTICLANKESLVVGGEIINRMLDVKKGKIIPIDSEHVALLKCLNKTRPDDVEKLILTASGGAFRELAPEKLKSVKAAEALHHPTWQMGAKITIDSATMMNKGFEIIEAHHLFRYPLAKIEIIMHDESHVHSLVKLKDGTLLADVSAPDMHIPIAYALFEGQNPYEIIKVRSLSEFKNLHFHDFDAAKYPCVALATSALEKGGTAPAILNAANEMAVHAFLEDKIPFLAIPSIIEESLSSLAVKKATISNIKRADRRARRLSERLING